MNPAGRLASWALLLLPGGLTIYLSFNGGGFFPNTQAFAALVLAAALALRIAFAEAPFAGFSKSLAVAAGGLGLYALWALLSALWSDAPARALLEFNLALLYLLALLLFGSLSRTATFLRWMVRGLALGVVVVCVCGLVTRVLPEVWPISETIADDRLSYPLTYWNALGLLASVGTILCFHLACSRSEPAAARVLGATAVPVLVTTLFFTFSRGAIGAGIVGLAIYVAVARPRALFSGLIATGPAAAIAVVVAYDADLLATENPIRPAAVDQGHEVALAVALCAAGAAVVRALLLRLDNRLSLDWVPAGARRVVPIGGAVIAVAVLIAVGAPGYAADQYDRFVEQGGSGGEPGDLRTRLTDFSNNGRIDQWDVALDTFADEPLAGEGAGTYQTVWARDRPIPLSVRDAHSLYVESLAELGLVGLILLGAVVITILVGLAARARGPNRSIYAAVLCAGIAWAVHAGVDWDWEMPAVTLWVFALGGAALAAPSDWPSTIARPGAILRPVGIVACLAAAVVPGLVLISDERLEESASAFGRGDCAAAIDAADSSISALPIRPEPYEIRAYCLLRAGSESEGLRDLERAIDRDPDNWVYHYGLARARAAAGLDPRPEAIRALRLNPLDPEAQDAARRFRTPDREVWVRRGRALLRGAPPFYLSSR
ncbi:MAG: O-antigen ligase family protein [Solirubrobacterales bacterium]